MKIQYSDEELVNRAMRNLKSQKIDSEEPRWVCVKNTFGVGSTVARAMCEKYGMDPDEEIDGPTCEACADHWY